MEMGAGAIVMKDSTSKKIYSIRRIFGKVIQAVARSALMPSVMRRYLYQMMGVNFVDIKSVFIGENVYFDDSRPDLISVGKNVRVTTGTKIFTHFFDTTFNPTSSRPFSFYDGKVNIGDCVFIGANVVIAKPVNIGDWAVIGANSVITKDVPPGAIVAGSPAKQVGSRVFKDRV